MTEPSAIRWLFERNVFEDGNPERMAKIACTNDQYRSEKRSARLSLGILHGPLIIFHGQDNADGVDNGPFN
jgi:hypothetical protein